MGLSTTGPRSLLGSVLPARNNAWINAGPRALVTFSASNADIKFPYRLPILEESHEILLFDVRTSPCYEPGDLLMQSKDLQCAMSVMAGYFGGYTSKMQDIGQKEVKRLGLTLDRQMPSVVGSRNTAQVFQYYSRRLVRDLEAKGIVRTAVESTLLSLHSEDKDVLMAECVRTFPSITFPAASLLKREEVECGKTPGASMITPVFHGHGRMHLMFTEAPFDLMYGYRGKTHNVDLLSPYEMLLHWEMTRIPTPSASAEECRSQWTDAGLEYLKECRKVGMRADSLPGVHYVALEDNAMRILIPDVEILKKCDVVGAGRNAGVLTCPFGHVQKCHQLACRLKRMVDCSACICDLGPFSHQIHLQTIPCFHNWDCANNTQDKKSLCSYLRRLELPHRRRFLQVMCENVVEENNQSRLQHDRD